MKIDYGEYYNGDYFTGKKKYNDGHETKNYHGPSLTWDGFDHVADALRVVLPHGPLLDVGCGGGDLARRLKARGFDPYGVDISEYAIENASVDMRDRLHICDISASPPLPPHFPETFKSVIATDLLEHIYEEDLEKTFNWILERTEKWLFFCVATAAHDKKEFILKKGEPVPPRDEKVAVSGHVNVRTFWYWLKFFENFPNRILRVDWKKMYLFQLRREAIPAWRDTMGWNMQTTFILEAL